MKNERKRFERGAEISTVIDEGILTLVGYDVDLKNSEILMEIDEFDDEILHNNFDIKTGEWSTEDGWVIGKNPEMCPGMIVSKGDFCGNVMLTLTAKTVAPSTHDINIMINGEWDDKINVRQNAYVAGLEAFWHGNIGFEKSPEYKLTAATHLFDFDPDKEYVMTLGNIGGKIFVLVDGNLCLEITDPDPLDENRYGKIGMEAYSSCWKFKNVKVQKIKYEEKKEYYNREF